MRSFQIARCLTLIDKKSVVVDILTHLVVERHKGRNVDLIRKYPALALYCATAQRLRTRYINLSPLKDIPSSRDLDRTFRLLRTCARASRVRDCLEQDLGRRPDVERAEVVVVRNTFRVICSSASPFSR